jgi:hypothetical protein
MFVTLLLLFVTFVVPLRHAQTPQKMAPPVAADEAVFQPSGKVYPRQPQMVKGRPTASGFDHIVAEWATVAEAAQAYADFSKKEVRVPRALLDRTLSFGQGTGSVAASYVVQALNWQLPYDGVDVAPLGRGVIGFRAGQSHQEKAAAQRPPNATPAEVTAARAAMSLDRFWSLIERTPGAAGKDCFKKAAALQASLRRLSADEILGFQIQFQERMAESYRSDLWGVAYLVNGGASDDGFEYFRAWLIGHGRKYFEAALKDPERAADLAGRGQNNECEPLLYCAMQAYESKTKRRLPIVVLDRSSQPAGAPWTEEDLPKLFPKVAKRFR